ncbi:MAG: SRPBCC family protein [Pseudomonadota bacterium]
MKCRLEIDIDLPRERVIALFDDPANLKRWQPELLSFEHLSGEPGQVGAKSRLRYQMGKREVELIETIIERRLPDVFSGSYETKGMWNGIENRFVELDNGHTRWIADNEFRGSGLLKLLIWLMPGAFKKQSFKYMQQFKTFAEQQPAD